MEWHREMAPACSPARSCRNRCHLWWGGFCLAKGPAALLPWTASRCCPWKNRVASTTCPYARISSSESLAYGGTAGVPLGSVPEAHCTTAWTEMLDKEDVDAVSIVTSDVAHCEIAVAALRRGLHVLCEKPMGPTVADCDSMCAAARRSWTRWSAS